MDNIFLVAPTTPEERTARIAAQASGFIYYVALKGVTGAGHLDPHEVSDRCRAHPAAHGSPGSGGLRHQGCGSPLADRRMARRGGRG